MPSWPGYWSVGSFSLSGSPLRRKIGWLSQRIGDIAPSPSASGREAVQEPREAQRLHGQVAAEEELPRDLVVVARALEAGEAEGELARLCDVEPDVGVVALRPEVEPGEGLARRAVVAEIGIVGTVLAGPVLRHQDRRLVELQARPADLGLSRVHDLVR